MWLSVLYKTSYHFMLILSAFSLFGSCTSFVDDFVVFRSFGQVDWVLNLLKELLFMKWIFEIYLLNKWLRNMVIEVFFQIST